MADIRFLLKAHLCNLHQEGRFCFGLMFVFGRKKLAKSRKDIKSSLCLVGNGLTSGLKGGHKN